MTYKIGDKVLVEGEFCNVQTPNGYQYIIFKNNDGWDKIIVMPELLRPYTPRQEFEYGEEVEVRNEYHDDWFRATYIGKSHSHLDQHRYIVNLYSKENGVIWGRGQSWLQCRKFTKPRETITIGGVDYYKDDVEKVLKDLKPIK